MNDFLERNKQAILAEQEAAMQLIKARVALESALREWFLKKDAPKEHQAGDCDCDECRKDRGRQ